MKRAVIDIGSNSILLLAGDFENDVINEELNESRITSLGKGLDKTGEFNHESMENSFAALKEYRDLLISRKYIPEKTIVTATEASRVSKNAKTFFEKVKNELGFSVQTISAQGEAYYTALGVASSLSKDSDNSFVIMDIGGASTELIKITIHPAFKINATISLPIGSVRATDLISEGKHHQRWEELKKQFNLEAFSTERLICVAGSMTALGAIYYKQNNFDAQELEGKVISKNEFFDFLSQIEKIDAHELAKQYPFLGKRIASIRGGSFVAKSFVTEVVKKDIMISTRGLRYGTFIAGVLDGIYIAS